MKTNNQIHRILFLDQSADSCTSLKKALKKNGFKLDLVTDFEKARHEINKPGQSAILLLHLPDDLFDEWLQKGKELLELSDMPLLFILNNVDEERFEAVQQCNSYGFVTPNIDSYSLLQTLHSAINLFESRQQAHRQAEPQLEIALDTANMGMWSWNIQTGRIYCSPRAELLFGIPKGSFKGTVDAYFDLIHPDDVARVNRTLKEMIGRDQDEIEIEHRIIRADGTTRWLESRGGIVKEENGKSVWVRGVVADITEKKDAEFALKQSEQRLTTAFQHIPFDFWICDSEGRYIIQNKKSMENWGNQIGQKAEDVDLSPDIKKEFIENNKRALKGETIRKEITYSQNGEPRHFQKIQAPIVVDEQILGLLGTNIDITKQKQTEAELNTLTNTFSAATGIDLFDNVCRYLSETLNVDFAFIGELLHDKDMIKVHSIYGDEKFPGSFGYDLAHTPCADMTGQEPVYYKSGVQDLFPEDELLKKTDAEGYIGIPLFSSAGNPLGMVVLLSKKPLKNVKQCRQYLQIYSNRVSAEMERLHAEGELRKREKELRSINEHISEGIYRSTPKDGLVYVNEAFASMFGYDSPEELLNIEGPELYASEGRRRELTDIEDRYGYIKNEEVEFKCKDGSTFWALMSGKVVHDEDGNVKYYDGSVLDITERKLALEENRRLREAIQQSPVAILITNAEGIIKYVNPKFLEQNGSTEEELLGTVAPILEKNDVTVSFYDELWQTIQNGKVWKGTIKTQLTNGETVWEEATISPVFNNEGEITYYITFSEDITRRKQHEEKLQNSISEKEVLLAEIHHRVKNNMAIISGLLELEAQNRQSDEVIKNIFHESQLRIQSMAMVHEKLYQAGNFTNLKLENYIAELVEVIHNTFIKGEKKVEIKIENTADVQLNINQAIPCALILNELATNAFKYAFNETDSGKLCIQLKYEDEKISLVVQDNGPGLPEDFEERSQESLGFVLIKQLTKQLEGELIIQNENGARFEIIFEKNENFGSSSSGYIIDRQQR